MIPIVSFASDTQNLKDLLQISEQICISIFDAWNSILFAKIINPTDLATAFADFVLAQLCSRIAETVFEKTNWQPESPTEKTRMFAGEICPGSISSPQGFLLVCSWM
jgi:hypothetical protein